MGRGKGKGKGKNKNLGNSEGRAKSRQSPYSSGSKADAELRKNRSQRDGAISALLELMATAVANKEANRGTSHNGGNLRNPMGVNTGIQNPDGRGLPNKGGKSLALREPDSQSVQWGFNREVERKQSTPVTAIWTWHVKGSIFVEKDLAQVVAEKDFRTGTYTVHIRYPFKDGMVFYSDPNEGLVKGDEKTTEPVPKYPRKYVVSGSAVVAKRLSEALLSAADWALAYRTVLGEDFTLSKWNDYSQEDRKSGE